MHIAYTQACEQCVDTGPIRTQQVSQQWGHCLCMDNLCVLSLIFECEWIECVAALWMCGTICLFHLGDANAVHSTYNLQKKCERFESVNWNICETTYLSSLTKAKIGRGPTKAKKKNYWPIRQAHEISILNRIYSHSMLDFGPLAVMSQCCRYVGCCDLLIRIENARHFVNGVWWHVILCSGMWRWHTMHDAGAYMRHNKQ